MVARPTFVTTSSQRSVHLEPSLNAARAASAPWWRSMDKARADLHDAEAHCRARAPRRGGRTLFPMLGSFRLANPLSSSREGLRPMCKRAALTHQSSSRRSSPHPGTPTETPPRSRGLPRTPSRPHRSDRVVRERRTSALHCLHLDRHRLVPGSHPSRLRPQRDRPDPVRLAAPRRAAARRSPHRGALRLREPRSGQASHRDAAWQWL